MTERAVSGRVRGRVQGVGFRWFTRRAARDHGILGWVRNEPDGSVAVVARGEAAALDAFLDVLRAGPAGARVEALDLEESDPSLVDAGAGFEIVR